MSIRITHKRLSDGTTHEHITHVAWNNESTDTAGSSTKAAVVKWIDDGGDAYVGQGSSRVQVGTIHPDTGTPYLRTYADGAWNNNLLSLPDF